MRRYLLFATFIVGAIGAYIFLFSSNDSLKIQPGEEVFSIAGEDILIFSFVSPEFVFSAQRSNPAGGFFANITFSNEKSHQQCQLSINEWNKLSKYFTIKARRQIESVDNARVDFSENLGFLDIKNGQFSESIDGIELKFKKGEPYPLAIIKDVAVEIENPVSDFLSLRDVCRPTKNKQ